MVTATLAGDLDKIQKALKKGADVNYNKYKKLVSPIATIKVYMYIYIYVHVHIHICTDRCEINHIISDIHEHVSDIAKISGTVCFILVSTSSSLSVFDSNTKVF